MVKDEQMDFVMVEDTQVCVFSVWVGVARSLCQIFRRQDWHSDGIFRMLSDFWDKRATKRCHIGISLKYLPTDHHRVEIFTGECQGSIVRPQGCKIFNSDGFRVPYSP
jgi:inosine/xanthosine triphosphate pyrophosphatase family protein